MRSSHTGVSGRHSIEGLSRGPLLHRPVVLIPARGRQSTGRRGCPRSRSATFAVMLASVGRVTKVERGQAGAQTQEMSVRILEAGYDNRAGEIDRRVAGPFNASASAAEPTTTKRPSRDRHRIGPRPRDVGRVDRAAGDDEVGWLAAADGARARGLHGPRRWRPDMLSAHDPPISSAIQCVDRRRVRSRRARPRQEDRVEEQPERAPRLAAMLRAEPEHDDAPAAHRDVKRRQPSSQSRLAARVAAGDQRFIRVLRDGAQSLRAPPWRVGVVHHVHHLDARRQPHGDGMIRRQRGTQQRARHQRGIRVVGARGHQRGQVEMVDCELGGVAQRDERAAGQDEVLQRGDAAILEAPAMLGPRLTAVQPAQQLQRRHFGNHDHVKPCGGRPGPAGRPGESSCTRTRAARAPTGSSRRRWRRPTAR